MIAGLHWANFVLILMESRGRVIAAKAGDPVTPGDAAENWTPAFAGMTPQSRGEVIRPAIFVTDSVASAPYIRTAYHRTCAVLHRMQLVSELFGHGARIDAVTDQLRPDENDDLRARLGAAGIAEQIPQELDVAQSGYSGLRFLIVFADEAAEENRLTARHRHRGMDAPLRNRRRQRLLIGIDDGGYLLIDLKLDRSVRVHVRQHLQDHAGIAHLDGIDRRRGRTVDEGGRAGRDRKLVADLQKRRLVVERDDRWRGENLDTGNRGQCVQDDARLRLGSEQQIEARQNALQRRRLGSRLRGAE